MCGILGYLNPNENRYLNEGEVVEVLSTLRHRGPDANGYYQDAHVFLGHTRLSIIDLSSGTQPIFNEDNTKCIVFNGEIFNYREIKIILEGYGHVFRTNTDTEVILHAYEQWDSRCIDRLVGMFSFAIYDIQSRNIFIVRDRLGVKPLFYLQIKDAFYFASEIKALLKMVDVPHDIDHKALASYFSLTYIPAPLTIFKQIMKLPAGHYMRVGDGKVTIVKYWDLYFHSNTGKTEKFFADEINNLLEASVSLRLISDVPVGAFLSGGIDSGVIVSMMAKLCGKPVHTFCMGYGGTVGGFLDERQYAQMISRKYNTHHQEYEVLPQVRKVIGDIVRAFDEPFADSSTIPSYYLCNLTRQSVKVALSGLGGDELFGGYERHLGFKLSNYYKFLPSFLTEGVIKRLVDSIPERSDGHYTINHLKRFVGSVSLSQDERYYGFVSMSHTQQKYGSIFSDPEALKEGDAYCREVICGFFNSENATDPLDKVFYTDIKTYLADDILTCTDRISMLHSLEVRVPFLDHKLMEFCATIPANLKIKWWHKKHILKMVAKNMLPPEILDHRKQGFDAPMASWVRHDLKDYVSDILGKNELSKHGLFNAEAIGRIIDDHMNFKQNNEKLIWSLVFFQEWYNQYL